jgi:RNA polymerase sigma-70 factor, ECF subfamily
MSQEAAQTEWDEAALVEAAQAGGREAFDALAARFRSGVLAMAFLRTGCRDAADDLAQEILTTAWQKLPSLRDPASFPAWIKSIALNACRTWYRRSIPWSSAQDDLADRSDLRDPAPTPLEALLARERQRALRQALLTLPAANRMALLMYAWGGSSYDEIAAFLQVNRTTVEGRIYRARSQLRRLLGDESAAKRDDQRTRTRQHAGRPRAPGDSDSGDPPISDPASNDPPLSNPASTDPRSGGKPTSDGTAEAPALGGKPSERRRTSAQNPEDSSPERLY